MNDERFEKFEPLYAEPDDRSSGRSAGARPSARPRRGGGAGGRLLALVALLAAAGLGWFSWQQQQGLEALDRQFTELRARLDSTGETLSESGASLASRLEAQDAQLDTHWSEIKKLWGVANDRNRSAIEQQNKALAGLEAELKRLEQDLKGARASAREAAEAAAAAKSQVAGLAAGIDALKRERLADSAALEELQGQVRQARTGVGALEGQVRELRDSVARSGAENRKALASIDTFRRETNLQLQALREQLSGP
jgi:chromosome segregation ATPase